MGLSHTISEINGNIGQILQLFSQPSCIYCLLWGTFPWNFVTVLALKKLEWCLY